jgi:hypothetical protein
VISVCEVLTGVAMKRVHIAALSVDIDVVVVEDLLDALLHLLTGLPREGEAEDILWLYSSLKEVNILMAEKKGFTSPRISGDEYIV